MNALILAFLLLAPQDEDRSRALLRQQKELEREITDLRRTLKETPGPDRKRRLQAALDRLETRLKHLKEGKIRPESDEPENEEEELRQALKRMEERLKANPSDFEALIETAEIRMHLGQVEASLKAIQAARKVEPNEPFLYILEGRAYLHLKKDKEAQEAFANAIQIEPDLQGEVREIVADVAPEKMSAMMASMKKMSEPKPVDIAAVNARLRANPKDVEALVLRARHSRERNKMDAAFDDLYAALRIDPRCAAAYFQRALAHAARGRFDRAERDFMRGERHMKPADFRQFRMIEREMRRLEHRQEERERSSEEFAGQIETLKERLAELEGAVNRPGATPADKQRAQAQIRDVRAEIERLSKIRETRPEGGAEPWEEVDRLHEKLETHERKMRDLARRIRAAESEDARKKLETELRALVVRFHEMRYEVMQKEMKAIRDQMEDLKFEIQDYRENKKGLVEETLRHLSEEEEDE